MPTAAKVTTVTLRHSKGAWWSKEKGKPAADRGPNKRRAERAVAKEARTRRGPTTVRVYFFDGDHTERHYAGKK